MVKLAHIYSLLILWSLIRLAERDDELKTNESELKEGYLLLARIRNLVQLAVVKLREAYRSGYDLVNFNGSLVISLNEFERLKKELRTFLYMVDSKRHALFNHKYRLLLAQINVLIDEIPRFEIATFDNTSFYQRVGLCFLSICNSLCKFFNHLECSISKLEEYNRKIDRLQMIANELRYFADSRVPRKGGRRKVRRDQLDSSELHFRKRRTREDEFDFRNRRNRENNLDFGRRRTKNDGFNFRNRRTREDDLDFRRRRTEEDELDFRNRRREEDELDFRRENELFEREFRMQAKTKKSRQKARRLQVSPLHQLIKLISYQYSKYSELVDRLYSITQNYWDFLANKLNEFLTSV